MAKLLLVCCVFLSGCIGVLTDSFMHDATSEDSHTVFNYLKDNDLLGTYGERFHKLNNDWPPTKEQLGVLLIDAMKTANSHKEGGGAKR